MYNYLSEKGKTKQQAYQSKHILSSIEKKVEVFEALS